MGLASARYDTTKGRVGLDPKEVTYLSFKGGGGKAWAYLGVLSAFTHDEIGLMTRNWKGDYTVATRIQGISGTSAGGLIGTLVACNYSLADLYDLVLSQKKSNDLQKFFDPSYHEHGRSYFPLVTAGKKSPKVDRWKATPEGDIQDSTERIRGAGYYEPADDITKVIPQLGDQWFPEFKWAAFRDQCLKRILPNPGDDSGGSGKRSRNVGPYPIIRRRLDAHLRNLFRDGGIFSGVWAREYMAQRLEASAGSAEMTFRDFEGTSVRGSQLPTLCLVGTDISPMNPRMAYFSADTTPEFRVADAMRITMSIPIAFKPVVVDDPPFVWNEIDSFEKPKEETVRVLGSKKAPSPSGLSGVWVDGGVSNQLPAHAFDDNRIPMNAAEATSGSLDSGVLAIDLQSDMPEPIEDSFDLFGAVVGGFTEVAATDREFRTAAEQTQRLGVSFEPLSTLNFTPSNHELAQAALAAAAADTFSYFGLSRMTNKKDLLSFMQSSTPLKQQTLIKAWDSRQYAEKKYRTKRAAAQ